MSISTEHPPRERLLQLRERAAALADRLDLAAAAIQQAGAVPAAVLVTDLAAFHHEYRTALDELNLIRSGGDPRTWDGMQRELQRRERQFVVSPLLQQVSRLSHRSLPDFEPLRIVQGQAAELSRRLSSDDIDPEEIAPYVSGEHGLAALVRLVEEADHLDDETWEQLRSAIERDLGRPLALAAARQHLQPRRDFDVGSADDLEIGGSELGGTDCGEGTGLGQDSLFSEDDPLGLPLPWPDDEMASIESPERHAESIDAIAVRHPANRDETTTDPLASPAVSLDRDSTGQDEVLTTDDDSVFDDWSEVDSERKRLARIELPTIDAQVAVDGARVEADIDVEPIATETETPELLPPSAPSLVTDGQTIPSASSSDAASDTSHRPIWLDSTDRRSQPVLVTPELQSLARRVDQSAGSTCDRLFAELIWRLLYDGLPDVAWQLAGAAKELDPKSSVASAESLQIWLIGHRITSEDRQLLSEYARAAEALANVDEGHPLQRPGHPERFLSIAGLLRGAALIPDSSASRLLQRLTVDLDDDILNRYVSAVRRLAEYETEFMRVRQAAEGDADPATMAQHQLESDIALWFESRGRDAVGFRRSEPLFFRPHWSVSASPLQLQPQLTQTIGSWLHVQRLVHALLQPALDDDRAAVGDVRSLANRIQNKLLIGDPSDYPPGCDKILVPRKDMADYLRNACDLAQRWVVRGRMELDDLSAPETYTVDVLRAEFDRCQIELVESLQQRALSNCELPMQTALGCLLLSVEQLAEAKQSEHGPHGRPLSVAEVRTAHLKGLRVCAWDQSGLPVCDRREFVDRVLLTLAESHVRPSRDVDGSPGDSPCGGRSDSGSECEELARSLQQALDEGLLSPHDHAAFNARLLAMQCGDRVGGISSERRMLLEDLERRLRTRGIVKSKGAVPQQEAQTRDLETQRSESVLLDD